ncbi:MAG TPA: ANTAR domain-containing protein [Nocardioidaceae bacterium]|nr:ANTAR domain-containing protein [Nocardioidaceae bacterium]
MTDPQHTRHDGSAAPYSSAEQGAHSSARWQPPAVGDDAVDELSKLRREICDLKQAMASREVIEQAKGVLILRYGLHPERAFAVLVRWSQNSNVKLHTVAETLVHAVCRDDRDSGYDEALVRQLEEQMASTLDDGGRARGEEMPTAVHAVSKAVMDGDAPPAAGRGRAHRPTPD